MKVGAAMVVIMITVSVPAAMARPRVGTRGARASLIPCRLRWDSLAWRSRASGQAQPDEVLEWGRAGARPERAAGRADKRLKKNNRSSARAGRACRFGKDRHCDQSSYEL